VTSNLFSIEMLPAQQGDALWIEYGAADRPNRILIDGGTPPTAAALRARIGALPKSDRHFDLIAVTHIDTDHIGGMLKLISDTTLGLTADDFWFNGWPQLPGTSAEERLGPIDGEILQRLIQHARLPWNHAFGGGAAVVPVDAATPLLTWTAAGGMRLTVLSPSMPQLDDLKRDWRQVLSDAGLTGTNLDAGLARAMRQKGVTPADLLGDTGLDVAQDARSIFASDQAVANSTSIGLLAEFDGRRALLTGDAWAPVLEAGIVRLLSERQLAALPIDVLKVAHHGSKSNTSMDLLERLRCSRFMFSTNGAIFHHPDHQSVSRAIESATSRAGNEPTLYFNYRSADNAVWDDAGLQRRYHYSATYPDPGADGLRVIV
jgi:beta-lactamase superfamily II metal-dependent hydrolase